MNKTLLFFFLTTSIFSAGAQKLNRHINIKTLNRDTVNIPLTGDYFLVEDNCSEIIRYTRFDFHNGKFYGKFKDVSKTNPKLVIAEGEYTDDGLKTGLFTTHYLNGNLRATGIFKDNKYDGRWEMFYEDGKPELTFEVVNGEVRIINSWNAAGLKGVDNGVGDYSASLGPVYWKGKLMNGKPDGRWKLYRTDDPANTATAEESFKKGIFKGGSSGLFSYEDVSRIQLVDPSKLSLVQLEHMYVSPMPCNGTKLLHVVDAQYKGGTDAFMKRIGEEVTPYLSKTDLSNNNTVEIEGEISEKGQLELLKNAGMFGDDIAKKIIVRLARLPLFIPATVDGRPVRQKIKIDFQFTNFIYQLRYRFLPPDTTL